MVFTKQADSMDPGSISSSTGAVLMNDEDVNYDAREFYLGDSNIQTLASGFAEVRRPGISSRLQSFLDQSDDDDDYSWISPDRRSPEISDSFPNDALGRGSAFGNDVSTERQAFDDGSIAFGTIRLVSKTLDDGPSTKTFIRGHDRDEEYPNMLINLAIHRRWLRLDGLSVGTLSGVSHIRVYIVPEDVNRSNRGSIQQFRKVVKYLLDFVDCTTEAWNGKADPNSTTETYKAPMSDDEESLFYIFNTLLSPDPRIPDFKGDEYGLQSMLDALEGEIIGLKTSLYPYQKRSVAAMTRKESDPSKIRDPRKTLFHDVYGNAFYLDMNDGSLFRTQPLYTESQGGILAETMGYGKTLICLALILATRGHYPQIPQDRIDIIPYEPRAKTASLLSMAARRLKHEGVPWKNEFHALARAGYHYDRCIKELTKYERSYAEPIFHPTTPSRKGKRESVNIVRLCSATLVIVPPNLLIQWQQEITKHVEEGALDVLVIDTPSTSIPQWEELVKYDVILMSKARFEQEYRDDDLNQGKSKRGESRYRSSLTDVRWLRVICDEGHGFAGSSSRTNAMAMLDKMFIERRWVVSGTPSRTLHGVEVDLATSTTSSAKSTVNRRNSVNSALKDKRNPEAHDLEAKDLERLRLIVVNFLKLQPWANQKGSTDKADWKRYLAPVTTADGKRRSRPALREILQTLIVRHRIEDVDADLTLPPLHNRLVYLKPSYYDKLAINLFVMVLISNYVTSEREDEDYMFHPRNRKKFDLLINNLRQATFFWCGFTDAMMQETLKVSNAYFDKSLDAISDRDGILLTEAIINGERALADPSWKAFSVLHEIGVYVSGFPDHAREAWALDGCDADPLLLGSVQAREVQKYVTSKLAKAEGLDPFAGLAGAGVRTMRAAREKAEEEQNERRKTKVQKGEDEQAVASEEPKLKGASASSSPVKTPRPGRLSKQKDLYTVNSTASNPELAKPQVLGFTSAKLTYLMDQVLQHSPSEKIIIFYSHNNVAFWVAEALELLHVTFLIYANTLTIAKRAQYLAQFNSDTETRVLLMDLKQAGQGLHVAAASRVYIISPIWDKSVESQAVKRAHRIGQTRPVYVETLVLEGTFEELMMKRRRDKEERRDANIEVAETGKETKGKDGDGGRALLDDSVMVRVLKEIQFLRFRDNDEKMARLDKPQPLFVRAITNHPRASQGLNSGVMSSIPKKRMASFEEDRQDSIKQTRFDLV